MDYRIRITTGKEFSLLHVIQTASADLWAHAVYYKMVIGGYFAGDKAGGA
jgi:hypothetical protein